MYFECFCLYQFPDPLPLALRQLAGGDRRWVGPCPVVQYI
jgi:hypothetical protein